MGLTVLKLKGPQSGDPRSYPYRPGLASTLYSSRRAIFSLRSLTQGVQTLTTRTRTRLGGTW